MTVKDWITIINSINTGGTMLAFVCWLGFFTFLFGTWITNLRRNFNDLKKDSEEKTNQIKSLEDEQVRQAKEFSSKFAEISKEFSEKIEAMRLEIKSDIGKLGDKIDQLRD